MLRLAITLSFLGCSPAYSAATGRCATTATLVADFVIASVGLAGSVAAYNDDRPLTSVLLFTGAMGVALAANLSACRR